MPVSAASSATAAGESSGTSIRRTTGCDVMSPSITRRGSDGLQVLVTVGRHDQALRPIETSRQEAQEVERRPVRPVQVLDHQHRRTRAVESSERGLEEPVALPRSQQLADPGIEMGSDVDERPERSRRDQRVAGSPEHQRGRTARVRAHSRTSADLPTPASPCTRTSRPDPVERLVAKARQGAEEGSSLHEWHRFRIGVTSGGDEGSKVEISDQLERGVVGGDEPLELLQLGPGFDAELVGESGSGALEGRQRLTLAARRGTAPP